MNTVRRQGKHLRGDRGKYCCKHIVTLSSHYWPFDRYSNESQLSVPNSIETETRTNAFAAVADHNYHSWCVRLVENYLETVKSFEMLTLSTNKSHDEYEQFGFEVMRRNYRCIRYWYCISWLYLVTTAHGEPLSLNKHTLQLEEMSYLFWCLKEGVKSNHRQS